jgi:hypothetical protein
MNNNGLKSWPDSDVVMGPEIVRDQSEFRKNELMSIVTHDNFKDALMMCGINMLETGKSNAFAIYRTSDSIVISDPILAESDSLYQRGEDTNCSWSQETDLNDFLYDDRSKKQKLLYKWDDESRKNVPRKDVMACVMSFPTGSNSRDLKSKDMQRPTRAWLDFFLQQDQLHPGFVGGILTNDGEKSGLLMFRKSEKVESIDYDEWGCLGYGDEVSRERILERMVNSGMAFADINLNCPNGSDPFKLYDKRARQAVESIF